MYGGGVASGTIVRDGGTETVFGRASKGAISSGGRQIVSAGGVASGGTVNSGGRQIVSAGGVASGAAVKLGGNQTVSSGGVARATVVSGGTETVFGTASGTIVYSGGIQNVHRVTHGTVLSGGTEFVSSGGAASGTIVRTGGKEIVYAGGTTNATTIRGGLVEVMSGAYVSGRLFTFAGGGTLQLDRSDYFKGRVAGFAVPDRLDLRDIAFVAGTTSASFIEAAGHTSGTLSVTTGAHTAKLTLLGSYVTSQFHLAGDGHGGTLVTDPPVAGGGASQTTFADIAPARLLPGASPPGNPATFLPGAMATEERSYAGHTLLATDLSGGPAGGDDHHPLLPAAH